MARMEYMRRFYECLARLQRRLGAVPVRLLQPEPWPERGVYFFMEPGETRSDTGRDRAS